MAKKKKQKTAKDRIVYKTFRVIRKVFEDHEIDSAFMGGVVIDGITTYTEMIGGRIISNGSKRLTYLLIVAYYV